MVALLVIISILIVGFIIICELVNAFAALLFATLVVVLILKVKDNIFKS